MKKALLILMIVAASFAAQARSVKLGYETPTHGTAKAVGKQKTTAAACATNEDCMKGYKCASGKCVRCEKGESGCNCALEMIQAGVCGCPDGKFNTGTQCKDYCDATVCEADYPKKVNNGRQCCCEK